MKMQISKDWLRKKIAEDNEPTGCVACGAIAGCCDDYPKCPGNEIYEAGRQAGMEEQLEKDANLICPKGTHSRHLKDAAKAIREQEIE